MTLIARAMIVGALLLFGTAELALAGGTPEDSGEAIHVNGAGYAAEGADVVAYFALEQEDDAVYGSEDYSLEWRGATWLFTSQSNLETFRTNPERYAPAYGGYCAYAIARDKLAPVDPDKWDIVDGTLYLNYSARTQRDWRDHQERDIRLADEIWPGWIVKLRQE